MDYIKNNCKTILLWLGLIGLVIFILQSFYQKQSETDKKLRQAIELTKQQAENVNVLQQELKLSKQNAELLADAVKKAQSNQAQPVTHIVVQAPTIEQAAALEDTDRTVVAPQMGNKDYQGGVYKINIYWNW